MRTLSDVFGTRGPLLPEGLRTLEVSPGRTIEPGSTVHAAFTFRNLGGGTASGFRVRFRLPEGLTYLVGTARIDDTALDEQGGLTTLLQASGADIGPIAAGAERRISLAYSVAATIENATAISVQAAIASFDVPVIGSNIVRLVVRSQPVLQNATTSLGLVPVREALPGEELQLTARVHNSGQSSAKDLVVLLPVPAQTLYVPQSVRVEGRTRTPSSELEPFGFARPAVVTPLLGPGATIDVAYRVRIDTPLEDATPIVATGAVCSQEIPEFAFAPVTVKIPSAASFAGDETVLRVECDDDVQAGQRLKIALRAKNTGTARARKPALKVVLPEGIAYSRGSLTIDGAPVPDRDLPDAIVFGDLEPGRSVEIALAGIVQSPVSDGQEFRLGGVVGWSKGQRRFERIVGARSAPTFPAAFNKIERETARRTEPGDAVTYSIALVNLGADVATDVRVQLGADPGIERLSARDGEAEITIGDDGTIALDTLEPGVSRSLRVDGHIASTIEDGTQLRLHASLVTAQTDPVELGAPVHIVASRPRFSAGTSQLIVDTHEALRPNRPIVFRIVLANEGTDRGRDVRVGLMLPDELRLERVDDATRDGATVVFGDIAAGQTRAAVVGLRLIGPISGGDTLVLAARVAGLNVVPFALLPVELTTHAEASFAEGAILSSTPAETIDAGAQIAYTLSLRNCGDGAARRLTARVATLQNAVYAPGSTTVNGIALQDFAGTSPLLSDSGLTLADVGAGVEVVARWCVIVNTPLAPATGIETAAVVRWDDTAEISVVAPAVRVRSTSALPVIEPELPFSVLGAVAAPLRSAALGPRTEISALTPEYVELRPAVRVPANNRSNGVLPTIEYAQLATGEESDTGATTLLFELDDEQLSWVVQYLEQTRVGGLVAHLLTVRALFPDRIGGSDRPLRARLRAHRELLAEHADRLFVKVRLPDFALQPSDVETPEMRASLGELFAEVAAGAPERPSLRSGLRLTQTVDRATLAAAAQALEGAALGTAGAWQATALFVGTTLERDGGIFGDFSAYRSALVTELGLRAALSPQEFHEFLREPVDSTLDDARHAVVRLLAEQQRVLN